MYRLGISCWFAFSHLVPVHEHKQLAETQKVLKAEPVYIRIPTDGANFIHPEAFAIQAASPTCL